MAEVVAVVLLGILAVASLAAVFVTLSLLIPVHAGRAAATLDRSPRRTFALGLVNLLFFTAVAGILSQGGDFLGLVALLLMLILLLIALVGLTGLVILLRQRLLAEVAGWRATAGAALLLVLTLAAPVIGWFLLGPLLLIAGLGSGILSLMQRTRAVEKDPY